MMYPQAWVAYASHPPAKGGDRSMDFTLLYIFNAKNYMTINIHHMLLACLCVLRRGTPPAPLLQPKAGGIGACKPLNDCLDKGEVYLDTFFFSLDEIEGSSTNLLTLD